MKKFIGAVIIAAAAVSASAEDYKFPGWGCKDIARWEKAAADCKKEQDAALCTVMLNFHREKPKTFDEFSKIVDRVCEEVYADPARREKAKNMLKKQFAFCRGQFLREACAYAQKNPSWYDYHLAMAYKGNNTVSYQLMRDALTNIPCYVYTTKQHVDGIKRMAATGQKAGIKSMPEDLQKLRSKYTAQQFRDKKDWSGVIAEIDTALNQKAQK